jgi:outer membrane protein TolC
MDLPFPKALATRALAIAATLVAAGCATFSRDGGFGPVQDSAKRIAGKDVRWVRTADDQAAVDARVAQLLSRPLGAEEAVQIALLNNAGLQASFQELGLAEADLVQASRLPNPGFSMLRARRGDEIKIEQTLTFNVLSLLAVPLATRVEQRRFEQARREAALEVLQLSMRARKAYIEAVAAEQSVRYQRQVKAAAEAAAELARRMMQVGNWSKLSQAREQAFYADATLELARSERAATIAREGLTRLLGLWGKQAQIELPERLPDLPAAARELPNVESLAMERRLDLQAIRLEAEARAKNLGLTKATRFINVLELGPARVLEGTRSDPYKNGYEVSFELPLFDFGSARLARSEAAYMQVVDRATELAVNARSEVREAYQAYRIAYDIARHYRDEIVPLRKRISDENQLRYNGMLIGVFDLLADARAQIAAVNGSVEALRDFWLAQADLDMAMIGKPAPMEPASRPAEASAAH